MKKLRILHLCHNYSAKPLYLNLINEINAHGHRQIIYVPVRNRKLLDLNKSENRTNIEYHFSYILNLYTRLNYFHKIKKIYNDILKKIKFENIDLIHAHFLFSDGGPALKLKEKFGIKYIVAVRNTDLNVFFKYLIHTRSSAVRILENAEKIIILSPDYKEKLLKYIPKQKTAQIQRKIIILPNGIDNYFIVNKIKNHKIINYKNINCLYIGEYSYNKNVIRIIDAVKKIKNDGNNLKLFLVGEFGNNVKNVLRKTEQNKSFASSEPIIADKKNLVKKYRSCDIFIMPSHHETFGLVYLEAMSQGLPVIYTKGQGIDGYFNSGYIGYSVNSKNIHDIADKIKKIIDNYQYLSTNCLKEIDNFNWHVIVEKYNQIYIDIIKNRETK